MRHKGLLVFGDQHSRCWMCQKHMLWDSHSCPSLLVATWGHSMDPSTSERGESYSSFTWAWCRFESPSWNQSCGCCPCWVQIAQPVMAG